MSGPILDNYPQFAGTAEVRAWARSKPAGASIGPRGSLPKYAIAAWNRAHPDRPHDRRSFIHGTDAGFAKGCRCHECSAAKTFATETYRLDRVERGLPVGDSRHGTGTGYVSWGCRCEHCREWQHRYYEAHKDGAA